MIFLKHIFFGPQFLQVKSENIELLYLNPLCQIDSKQTLRGGIPVVFSPFVNFVSLKKHGFVRDCNWKLVNHDNNQNDLFEVYEYVIAEDHFPDCEHSAKLNFKATVTNNVF
jgi:D-hexose-6-phosphate mutarotase